MFFLQDNNETFRNFRFAEPHNKGGKRMKKNKKEEKPVIAHRKTCKAQGTGLSHYILMDKKTGK